MSFMKKLTKGAQKVMGTVGDSVDKGQFSFPLPLRTHENFKDASKINYMPGHGQSLGLCVVAVHVKLSSSLSYVNPFAHTERMLIF